MRPGTSPDHFDWNVFERFWTNHFVYGGTETTSDFLHDLLIHLGVRFL